MLAETVAIVATVAAVGSFVFAGWQSTELANQTRFSNQLAATNAMRESLMDLHESLSVFLEPVGSAVDVFHSGSVTTVMLWEGEP